MSVLLTDVMRTYDLIEGGRLKKILVCGFAPGVQAVVVFRFGHWVYLQPKFLKILLQPVYMVLNGLIQVLWGIEIQQSAQIGSGLYIGHFGGITISGEAVIGKLANISQNVTIGVSGQGKKRGVPIIGDNVYIAPGARLFGKISIGNNVKIGANAVIHKNIPDDVLAVSYPGFKIISGKNERDLDSTKVESSVVLDDAFLQQLPKDEQQTPRLIDEELEIIK
jgi:serine O-acetyltransferase